MPDPKVEMAGLRTGTDLFSGNSLWFDALDDADRLNDESDAIWRTLHRTHLHHVVLVQRLEARQRSVLRAHRPATTRPQLVLILPVL